MTENLPVQIYVAMQEVHRLVDPAASLEAQLQAAMKGVQHHWMATEEDHQFHAAIGAVLMNYTPDAPEWNRIKYELAQLKRLKTLFEAARLGLSVEGLHIPENAPEPIGLLAMWRASRARETTE